MKVRCHGRGGVSGVGSRRTKTDLPPHRLLERGIFYIPQESSLFRHMSVADNLRLPLETLARRTKGNGKFSVADRLTELDADLAAAHTDHDIGRAQQLGAQRTALIAELRRATGLAGRSRMLGTSTTERARKAVTARLREAIHRIAAVLPELGAHLDRSVITGTTCHYQPVTHLTWTL